LNPQSLFDHFPFSSIFIPLYDLMFASMLANILALATSFFSMNVYDRLIPAQSTTTLWVLAGGVLIAAIFEFSLKVARIYLSDIIGKRADLRIMSDK